MRRIVKTFLKRMLRSAVARSHGPNTPTPDHWDLAVDQCGGLALRGVSLHGLLQKHGSPLMVLDVDALKRNCRKFLHSAAIPAVETFYSYKTNPVAFALSTLHSQGVGAEVISSYELWLALRLGVPPERIIYNGPLKSEESVREALARDIALITANHPEEIPYLADIASSMGARARMGIRVSIEDGWSGQFGVPMGEAALEAFSLARSLRSLDVRALHVHRGGMIRTAHELRTMVRAALAFSDQLAARLGIELSIIDFGGSLCTPSVDHISSIDYRLNRALHRQVPPPDVAGALTIESHCSIIRTMVAEHFGRAGRQCPRIFLEPGRALTGNTQMLLTRVHALKHAPDRTYAILDGGINIAEPVRSEYHQLFSVNRPTEPHDTIHTLVGPICTPADTLYPSVRLPRLQVGDSLAIMDAGAYFVPFATSFSFPQPAIVAVDGSTDYIVRRAETFEDMNARDGLPVHAEPTPAARC